MDRSSSLIHDILDIEHKSSSSSEDKDDDDHWWWTQSLSWRSQRSSGRRDSRSSLIPFDRVEVDSSIIRPIKHQIITVLKTHGGGTSEKKIQIQLTHILSEDMLKHQDDIQIIYTPLLERSTTEKKVCWN